MSSWLQKQKKADLHDLATQAGLKDTSQLKKDDLITALDDHLYANATSLSSNPSFAEYYRTSRRATSDGDSGQPKQRRRTTNVVAKQPDVDTSPEREAIASAASSAASSAAAAVSNTVSAVRTPQAQRAMRAPFPPTPADVADFADRQTAMVTRRVRKYYRESGLTEYLEWTREQCSSVPAISVVFLFLELYGLQKNTLPWRHAFTIPASPLTQSVRVSAPDMFLMLSGQFWAPIALWFATSVFIPLVVGALINLTVANEGRSTRRRASYYAVDPLIFSLTKAGFAWLVFAKGTSLGGLVDLDVAIMVERALPGGWVGIVIGSLVGVVASLYDAVLRK